MAHGFGKIIGDGTFEKRGANVWRVRMSLGRNPETGKYEYAPSFTVKGLKSEAKAKAAEYRRLYNEKIDNEYGTLTVTEYIDQWQDGRRASNEIKPATCDRDEPLLARLKKYFGDYAITELTVADIKRVYTKALKKGELSESMHHMIH